MIRGVWREEGEQKFSNIPFMSRARIIHEKHFGRGNLMLAPKYLGKS